MMPARILRWRGGYAGDMLMRVMHLSGHNIANVRYQEHIDHRGRVMPYDPLAPVGPTGLERMAQDQHHQALIDLAQLMRDIQNLGDVWIKSHYYVDAFDDITTDINVDAESLPFVISACVYKTDILKTHTFHPLADRIQDADTRIKLAMHAVGRQSLDTVVGSAARIRVGDLLKGWDRLCAACQQAGIYISMDARQFYQDWHDRNQKYLPSDQYVSMVQSHDFDYAHADLSTAERYSLLALSGNKFRLLP